MNFSGAFAYIEASYPRVENDVARLRSKVFRGSKCMAFHYHMYSADPKNVGSLNVYIKDVDSGSMVKLFSLSGSQGNEWKVKSLDLVPKKKGARYQVCIYMPIFCQCQYIIFKLWKTFDHSEIGAHVS